MGTEVGANRFNEDDAYAKNSESKDRGLSALKDSKHSAQSTVINEDFI